MKNRDKPYLVGAPVERPAVQPGRPVVDVAPLWQSVIDCFEAWLQWAPSTERGVLTPTEFLAVLWWVLKTNESTEDDAKLIVTRWSKALLDACRKDVVIALHPVSLLPLESGDPAESWVLSIAHATDLMCTVPWGFDVGHALEDLREQARKLQESIQPPGEAPTLEQVAERRKAANGGRWADADRRAVAAAVSATSIKDVAEVLGIYPNAVKSAIKGLKKPGPAKASFFPVAAQPPGR